MHALIKFDVTQTYESQDIRTTVDINFNERRSQRLGFISDDLEW